MRKEAESIRQKLIEILKTNHPEFYTKVEFALHAKIDINPRMRTTAGKAWYKQNRVELNMRLLTDHPEHLEQTVAHEFAHLIAYQAYNRAGLGHGKLWQLTMQKLGYKPERCHNLESASKYRRRQKPAALAECGCENRTYNITRRKYNRVLRGEISQRCRICKQKLSYTEL